MANQDQGQANSSGAGRPPARFDPTINLGHIISAGTMVIMMTMGWSQLSSRLEMVEKQVAGMSALIERSIRTDTRVDELSRRIGEIEQRVR